MPSASSVEVEVDVGLEVEVVVGVEARLGLRFRTLVVVSTFMGGCNKSIKITQCIFI